jgi:O-antigen/teichoic acid export membrane protein
MAGTDLETPSGAAPLADAGLAGRVVAGGAQRVVAFGVINLITAAAALLLLRYLGVRNFGRYGTVMALMAIVQGVTDGGLTLTGARELSLRSSQAERADLLGNLIGLRILFTGVGVLAGVLFALAVGYSATLVEGTALVGISVFLLSVQSSTLLQLTVDLENSRLAVNDVLRQLVLTLAFVALVIAGTGLVPFFAASPAAALIVFACTPWLLAGRPMVRPRWRGVALRALTAKTLPLALFGVLSVVYFRVLVILMSVLQSSALQLGYYVTSARVMETFLGIPVVLIGVVLPVLSVSARDDLGRLQYVTMRLTESMGWLGVLLAVVLGTGARSILLVFGGSQYTAAAPILQIQCLALITIFVTAAWTTALVGMGRTRDLAIATMIGLVAVVVVGSILITADGARGAAVAAVVADVLYCMSAGVYVRRGTGRQAIHAAAAARLAVSALPALVLAATPILPNAIACIVATLLFLVLSLVLGAIPPEIIDHTPLHRLRRS